MSPFTLLPTHELFATKKLIISAPFGNYLSEPLCISTLGTYTYHNRAGFLRWRLYWRLLRTLRYQPSLGVWRNKLGLPNPGMDHIFRIPDLSKNIVSIHGFTPAEWRALFSLLRTTRTRSKAIELNISCPNIGAQETHSGLFEEALHTDLPVIVKLPPTTYWELFLQAYKEGIRIFHCCNTLSSRKGGLSGDILKPLSIDVIKRLKDYDPGITIIGGGGIRTPADVVLYKSAGAEAFALGSVFLSPSFWLHQWHKNICRLDLSAYGGCEHE